MRERPAPRPRGVSLLSGCAVWDLNPGLSHLPALPRLFVGELTPHLSPTGGPPQVLTVLIPEIAATFVLPLDTRTAPRAQEGFHGLPANRRDARLASGSPARSGSGLRRAWCPRSPSGPPLCPLCSSCPCSITPLQEDAPVPAPILSVLPSRSQVQGRPQPSVLDPETRRVADWFPVTKDSVELKDDGSVILFPAGLTGWD